MHRGGSGHSAGTGANRIPLNMPKFNIGQLPVFEGKRGEGSGGMEQQPNPNSTTMTAPSPLGSGGLSLSSFRGGGRGGGIGGRGRGGGIGIGGVGRGGAIGAIGGTGGLPNNGNNAAGASGDESAGANAPNVLPTPAMGRGGLGCRGGVRGRGSLGGRGGFIGGAGAESIPIMTAANVGNQPLGGISGRGGSRGGCRGGIGGSSGSFNGAGGGGNTNANGGQIGGRGGLGGGFRGNHSQGAFLDSIERRGVGSSESAEAGRFGSSERGRRFGARGRGGVFGTSDGGHDRYEGGEQSRTNGQNSGGQQQRPPKDPNYVPYVPKKRDLEEIQAEDDSVKDNYKIIREEDEDLVVTGPGSDQYIELETWAEFGFEDSLLQNIAKAGYTRPRKIQSMVPPLIKDGLDVFGQAETGSGKSAAFLMPIIDVIMKKKKSGEFESRRHCPYALILAPTRELVVQLYEQAVKLANGCNVSVSHAYGGYICHFNLRHISTDGCDILIGTVGRLLDFFKKALLCDKLKVIVFDEVDRLLEDNFVIDLRKFDKIAGWPKIEDRQNLMFSATFPIHVQNWANEWTRKDSLMVSNRRLVAANSRILQSFVPVNNQNKKDTLLRILELELEQQKARNTEDPKLRKTMVFVNYKRDADVLSAFLNDSDTGLKSTTINADRSQEQREQALYEFRTGVHQMIVTTDVCARGHDIKNLDHVINMDLPSADEYTIYVQRIGRTGRLKTGYATSLVDPEQDIGIAKHIVNGLIEADSKVPKWLQQLADGNPIEGQLADGAVSDQDLLNNVDYGPLPPPQPPAPPTVHSVIPSHGMLSPPGAAAQKPAFFPQSPPHDDWSDDAGPNVGFC